MSWQSILRGWASTRPHALRGRVPVGRDYEAHLKDAQERSPSGRGGRASRWRAGASRAPRAHTRLRRDSGTAAALGTWRSRSRGTVTRTPAPPVTISSTPGPFIGVAQSVWRGLDSEVIESFTSRTEPRVATYQCLRSKSATSPVVRRTYRRATSAPTPKRRSGEPLTRELPMRMLSGVLRDGLAPAGADTDQRPPPPRATRIPCSAPRSAPSPARAAAR